MRPAWVSGGIICTPRSRSWFLVHSCGAPARLPHTEGPHPHAQPSVTAVICARLWLPPASPHGGAAILVRSTTFIATQAENLLPRRALFSPNSCREFCPSAALAPIHCRFFAYILHKQFLQASKIRMWCWRTAGQDISSASRRFPARNSHLDADNPI